MKCAPKGDGYVNTIRIRFWSIGSVWMLKPIAFNCENKLLIVLTLYFFRIQKFNRRSQKKSGPITFFFYKYTVQCSLLLFVVVVPFPLIWIFNDVAVVRHEVPLVKIDFFLLREIHLSFFFNLNVREMRSMSNRNHSNLLVRYLNPESQKNKINNHLLQV